MPADSHCDRPPADFDAYWGELVDELDSLPIAAEETPVALRTTDDSVCYAVRLTSWGPYRVFGWLTIPRHGSGPFPTIYYLPRYQSVVEIVAQGESVDKRRTCATFSIACRGQRNADRPFRVEFPGLLTHETSDPRRSPLRGWVADCLRGLDYLRTRPEVDRTRIAGVGYNDFALIAAALRPGLCCVTALPGLFYRISELHPRRSGYPLEEYNDFVRAFPERAGELYHTVNYFDPRWFAERIRIPTLLWGDPPIATTELAELQPLIAALGPHATPLASRRSRALDGIAQEEWLARQLVLPEPILPVAWR